MYKYLRAAIIALALTLWGGAANAQLSLTIVPDTQAGAPGATVTFFGALSNVGPDDITIDGDTPTLIGLGLTLDDSKFNQNAPLVLSSGMTTGTFALFDVAIASSATPGSYPGSFSVQGTNSVGQDALATSDFFVTVTANAPEPAAMTYLLLGGVCGIVLRRRFRGARSPFL